MLRMRVMCPSVYGPVIIANVLVECDACVSEVKDIVFNWICALLSAFSCHCKHVSVINTYSIFIVH